jgi:UDP-glucuronate 4-epimerase
MDKLNILITGGAGFIGSHLYQRLKDKHNVFCLDNFNDHLYDPKLKRKRVNEFKITHWQRDIRSAQLNDVTFLKPSEVTHFDYVIHLAAHAGVRDSFGKESEYHSNNIEGTQQLIDAIKYMPEGRKKPRVIYASTSSVYGGTPITEKGWVEDDVRAHQLNAYAYTKYVNECQFKASGLENVGLRFFTVYGPWGRPDMALFQFTKKILDGETIDVYNYGDMKRDFTYIDDIIDGIEIVLNNFEEGNIESNEIFNIGRGEQVPLMDFIKAIERNCGKEAIMNLCEKHPADTKETWSNTEKLQALGYNPKVSIDEGVKQFFEWYKEWIPKLGDVTNGR